MIGELPDVAIIPMKPGLTTEEVAVILDKHPNRIREMIHEGKLDALLVIDRMFVPQNSVDAYLACKAAKARS